MNILMLTESNFPCDVRVRQEALKLRECGHNVSIIAIKDKEEAYFETVHGVKVYRVPKIELFRKGKQNKLNNNKYYDNKILLIIFWTAVLKPKYL